MNDFIRLKNDERHLIFMMEEIHGGYDYFYFYLIPLCTAIIWVPFQPITRTSVRQTDKATLLLTALKWISFEKLKSTDKFFTRQ